MAQSIGHSLKSVQARSWCTRTRGARFDRCGAVCVLGLRLGSQASQPAFGSHPRRAPSLRRLRAADKSAPRRDSHRVTQLQSLDAGRASGLGMMMRCPRCD